MARAVDRLLMGWNSLILSLAIVSYFFSAPCIAFNLFHDGKLNLNACIHKADYRFGQNPPILNDLLRKVINRYEALHIKSTAMEHPVMAFKRSVRSSDDIQSKYIYMHVGASGLGNRLLSIVSGYLLALLTDRVLIVHSPDYDLNTILCSPFSNSPWVLPIAFDVNYQTTDRIKMIEIKETTDHIMFDFYSGELNATQILRFRDTENYFLTSFFYNQYFRKTLQQWFPNKNVGTVLLKYLIHPSNGVWLDVLDSMRHKPKMALSVGVQVRFPVQYVHAALSCLDINTLPDHAHIFVASLMPCVKNVSRINPHWNVSQKYTDGKQINDNTQVMHALHDIFLLSLTDRTVVSAHSTFGYLIMALKGAPCAMVGNDVNPFGLTKDMCTWPTSHEICNHQGLDTLRELNLTGQLPLDTESDSFMSTFSGACVDSVQGIQLRVGRNRKNRRKLSMHGAV